MTKLAAAFLLFLAACSSVPPTYRTGDANQLIVESMPIACGGQGAIWVQQSQIFVCSYYSTPDAGAPCSDQTECYGFCIAETKVPEGTKSTGICSSRYVEDVAQYISHGIAGPELWH
jgi:hypothetical protein